MAAGSIGDKTLKVRFEIEESSVRAAKRAIEEITRSLKELNKEAGGSIGGGMGGSAASTQPAIGRAINKALTGGNTKGGIATADTLGFQNIRRLGEETNTTLRNMTNNIRDTVSNQIRELNKLRDTVDGVARSFGNVASAAGGGPAGPGGMFGVGPGGVITSGPNAPTLMMNGGGGGGGGVRKVGGGGGGSINPFSASGVLQLLGTPAGVAGGIVTGAAVGWNFGLNYGQAEVTRNLEQPLMLQKGQARIGQALGTVSAGIRGGDFMQAMMFNRALQQINPFSVSGQDRKVMDAMLASGGDLAAQQRINAMRDKWLMDPSGTALRYDMGMTGISAELAERVRSQIDLTAQANPQRQADVGAWLGATNDRISAMNLLGMGERRGRKVQISPGIRMQTFEPRNSAIDYMNLMQEKTGMNPEWLLQAQSGLISAGGMAAGELRGRVADLTQGNFLNAPGIVGGFSRYFRTGGPNLNNFLFGTQKDRQGNVINQSVLDMATHAAGFDAVGRSMLAQGALGMMTPSLAPTSGRGLMNTIGGFAGFEGPGSLQIMEMAQTGLRGFSAMEKGKLDPLSEAISTIASIQAGPNLSIYGQRLLRGMSPQEMTEIVNKGVVPIRYQGIFGADEAKQYVNQVFMGNLQARYSPALGDESMNKTYRDLVEAGSPAELLKSRYGNLTGKAKQEAGRALGVEVGRIMQASGIADESGMSEGQWLAVLGMQTGQLGRGGGVGRASRNSLEEQKTKAEGQAASEREERLTGDTSRAEIQRTLGSFSGLATAVENVSKALNEDLVGAVKTLTNYVKANVPNESQFKTNLRRSQIPSGSQKGP